MAVYEHTYRNYAGPLTPEWSRFLIIPRHALHDIFKWNIFSVLLIICLVISFIPLLVESILIYLHHNVNVLAAWQLNVRELLPIDASFFQTFVNIQGSFAFLVTLLVGPPLVARDLRNNALPLYLCRPFSRSEYVAGKMAVVLFLLSIITWIPQLLLFLLQSYLEGVRWFVDNLWIAVAIFIGSLVWILLLALLSQAISAVVKWRIIASGALLGIAFIPSVFGEVVNQLFRTRWGSILSLFALMKNVSSGLFRTFEPTQRFVIDMNGELVAAVISEPPLWCSWLALFVISAICLAILSAKVKAYEVVK
jgi:ABC-type transport system involved in multi-copper enzyme maturation permease subunit